MLKRSLVLASTVLVVGVLFAAYLAVPVGADQTTKSRIINSCRTIDTPGSYVLDRNLQITGNCLVVATSHVTIDLAGYTISGISHHIGIGVTTLPPSPFEDDPPIPSFDGITVRNGSITGFEAGMVLRGRHHLVEEMRVTNNKNDSCDCGEGITLVGSGNTVRNSIASDNGIKNDQAGTGISLIGTGNSIIGNVANDNGNTGIAASCPSTLVNNVATGNEVADIVADPVTCTRHANWPPL